MNIQTAGKHRQLKYPSAEKWRNKIKYTAIHYYISNVLYMQVVCYMLKGRKISTKVTIWFQETQMQEQETTSNVAQAGENEYMVL